MTKRRGAKLVAATVVLPLAALLAACGSSAKSATSVSHSERTAETTTTTTGPTTTIPPSTTTSSTALKTTPPTTVKTTTSTTLKSTVPSTTAAAPVTSAPTTALPPLASPAGGFVVGHVTAVGDSVMLDYQSNLQTDVPGVDVEAAVSRQWATGEQLLQELRSEGRLGAVVVVALGTNGPITERGFRRDDVRSLRRLACRLRQYRRRSTLAGSEQSSARERGCAVRQRRHR